MKHLFYITFLLISMSTYAQKQLIQNVNLFDVENGRIVPNQNVLIDGERIAKISDKKIKVKNQESVIDGTGKYLLPGLIDTHMHFFQTGSLYTRPDALDLRKWMPYEEEMAFAKAVTYDSFKRYLRLGITTIMDVGGPLENFKVRDQYATKELSPNVLVTGPLFSPYQPDAFSQLEDQPIAKINTIEEADALFKRMLPLKPDFLKIWYIDSPTTPAASYFPVAKHIANLAHTNGIKLAVHATQFHTAKLAVEAGADILVHSVDDKMVDEAFAKSLTDNNVLYIPTLLVSKNYVKAFASKPGNHPQDLAYANAKAYGSLQDLLHIEESELPPNVLGIRKNLDKIIEFYGKADDIMAKNLLFLHERGVLIGTGTDAGNIGTMHASSYMQELELMEKSGLSIPAILKAATLDAAKGFGIDKDLGSIQKGKRADLVLLNNNPLESLSHLNAISHIVKDGQFLEVNDIIEETAEQIVQRQLNAYNARDIEAFLDTYSEDVALYNYPANLRSQGKDAMREGYAGYFQNTADLHCEIKNRIVIGNKVIDQEYITANGSNFGAVAIYEVTDGKISKVTFL